MTTITPLPDPPTRQDPANFAVRADDFLAALPTFATQTNAVATELNAASAAAVSSASTASTAAGTATTAAGTATTAAGTATTAANNAVAAYDAFDDRYLGSKASDPTLDNDGNALLEGCLYWNTVAKEMRAYNGTTWAAAYVPVAGLVAKSGDTMTGPLAVPAGASGSQVPRASEVRGLAQLTVSDMTATTGTVASGQHKTLSNVAASTVTGPAAAAAGDRFRVSVLNGLATNVINWNGLKHEGLSDSTMTIDGTNATFECEYISAGFGWKITSIN